MHPFRFALIAVSLAVSAAIASPTDPTPSVEYSVMANPQPSETSGKKVEVIEVFMYHCPFCHAFEPVLEQWVKKQGDNIIFKRLPMPSQGASDPEAHLFLTLQVMGKSEEYQGRLMDAVGDIVKRKQSETLTEQEVLDIAYKLPGLDQTKFKDTWNSLGVSTMLNRMPDIVFNDYKLNRTPTIIVDGKYVTSPGQVRRATRSQSQIQAFQETLEVVDALVAKVQKSK